MLCINAYPQEYIDECRSKVAEHLAAYQALVAVAKKQAVTDGSLLGAAIETFEPSFFNTMLLALESHFAHRARAIEKKDGNPLNEVRMLCNAIINNNSVLCADTTIKYNPATSVLKYQIGAEIRLHEADFMRLSAAFLAEVERKYR